MNLRLSTSLIASSLALTGLVSCSDEATNPVEIVRLRTATATECADGGQTILVGLDGNNDGMLEGDEIISSSPVCNGSVGDPGAAGAPGADGTPGTAGVPGTNALVVTAAEAAGANCAGGGVRLDVGIDDNGDGTLQAGEIDATSYICNGANGADGAAGLSSLIRTSTAGATACGSAGGVVVESGLDADSSGTLETAEVTDSNVVCNGSDGHTSLVVVNAEAPGSNCAAGGQQIISGIDDNGDGLLTGIEIADTSYVCDPLNNLVNVSAELSGTSTVCVNGGSRVQVGLDTNTNGTLDASEVTQTSYSCNGAAGANGSTSLVTVTPEPAGANCVNGGQVIRAGLDSSGNGTLEAGEVVSTTYVCDGAAGQDGQDGTNGASGALVRVSTEAAGANCLNGGSRIESGPDSNFNGVLDAGEITATAYACDGAARESLVISTSIAPGPQCATGGFRVDSGLDTNGSGTLQAGEITSTSFVCNGLAAVPFAIQTATLPDGIAGQPYSATLTAAGGTGGSYAWSISAGSLPGGLTLDPTGTPDAVLSGAPLGGGVFNFTVQVTDFFGQSASRAYTVRVAGPILEITTFVAPIVDVNVPYTFNLGATGGSSPYTWSVVRGPLPTGLSLSNGVISGTPTVNRRTNAVLRVTDGSGSTRDARIDFVNRRSWVGFSADATTDTVSELYVVNVSTGVPGAPITINPPVVAGGALGQSTAPGYLDAKFSLSGDKMAFIGDLATDTEEEIWFVDLTTGTPSAPVRANPPYSGGTQDVDTDEYNFSPDGRWLWYMSDETLDSEFNLYIVDTTAPLPVSVQVNGVLPATSDVDTFDGVRVSPDSSKIAYISDEGTAAVEQLYVVDLSVQPFVPQLVSSGDATSDIFTFIWTDDSTSLVYAGDDLTDGVTELFIVNVSGAVPGPRVRLNAPMTNADGDVGTTTAVEVPADFGLSPDGTKIFYIADARTESVDELYVVDLAAPGVARLVSQDGRTNTGDDVDRAYWTPDSQSLVFVGDTETTGVLEVFLADATGAGSLVPVALNAPFVTNGDVSQGSAAFTTEEVIVHPENRGVFYMADGETDAIEVVYYSSFLAPGAMTNVSPNISGVSDVNSFTLSRTGDLLVFNGDPTASAVDELFSVDTSGAVFGAPLQINGTLPTNGDVYSLQSTTSRDYAIVNDGSAVIYLADELVDNDDQPFYTPMTAGVPGTSVPMITCVAGGDAYQVYR